MDKDWPSVKHAALSPPSGECNDNDFDVLSDGGVVAPIFDAANGSLAELRSL